MSQFLKCLSLLLVIVLFTGGCANFYSEMGGVSGLSIRDLMKAKATGKEKVFALSYDATYDKMINILKANELTIYQSDRKEGYIVAMGFPKQTDTTRVGIFLEASGDDKTKVTLSSLSTSARIKAENVIFGGIQGEVDEAQAYGAELT